MSDLLACFKFRPFQINFLFLVLYSSKLGNMRAGGPFALFHYYFKGLQAL